MPQWHETQQCTQPRSSCRTLCVLGWQSAGLLWTVAATNIALFTDWWISLLPSFVIWLPGHWCGVVSTYLIQAAEAFMAWTNIQSSRQRIRKTAVMGEVIAEEYFLHNSALKVIHKSVKFYRHAFISFKSNGLRLKFNLHSSFKQV